MNKKYSKAEVEAEVKLTIDRCLKKITEARSVAKDMGISDDFQSACDIFEGILRMKVNSLLPVTLFQNQEIKGA